ncbi:MAG: lipoprotein insertase outer membrane protein LolB [Burkholderiaceae bacterium]|nr:lipoprotein insertase outer membrane protein LolB [Burkholderiaceae bacterium]
MNQYRYSPFFIICAALLVTQFSACSSLPVTSAATQNPINQTSQSNQAGTTRHYQDHLQLNGRLTIRYTQNDKEQSITANFEWQQDPSNTEITLISPTGQIVAKIEQNASGARLQQANQPPHYAANMEALLRSQLGWSLPVAGLRDWLQGYTKNADQSYRSVPPEDDARLEADDWQLRYASWAREQGAAHPKRIDLYRNDSQAGEIAIKILIDQWTTP